MRLWYDSLARRLVSRLGPHHGFCYPDGAYCPQAYDALPGGGISFTFKRRDTHLTADTAQGEPTGN